MNGKDIRTILGLSLKELRTSKGLTQEKLAELIGKQFNAVNRIEVGASFLTSDTLAELCNVLEVNPDVLFLGRPQLVLKEHSDYIKEINAILKSFPVDKLKTAYSILSAMSKE